MSSDLSDVRGCCGAGSFWGDGLSTEQHARVQVTISVDLFERQKHSTYITRLFGHSSLWKKP